MQRARAMPVIHRSYHWWHRIRDIHVQAWLVIVPHLADEKEIAGPTYNRRGQSVERSAHPMREGKIAASVDISLVPHESSCCVRVDETGRA